jgi:hypothetical protein
MGLLDILLIISKKRDYRRRQNAGDNLFFETFNKLEKQLTDFYRWKKELTTSGSK